MRKKINTRSDILLFKRRSFKRIRFKKFKKKLFHKFFRIYSVMWSILRILDILQYLNCTRYCLSYIPSLYWLHLISTVQYILATPHSYFGYIPSLSWPYSIPKPHPSLGFIPFLSWLHSIPIMATPHLYLGYISSLSWLYSQN